MKGRGMVLVDRDGLTARVNAARSDANVALRQLPTLVVGMALSDNQYAQALLDAEHLAQASLRYTRNLAALAALDARESA